MLSDDPWARALALLTPDALLALREGPDFRRAIGAIAATALESVLQADAFGLQLWRHRGRRALFLTLLALDARHMGVTARELIKAAEIQQAASRGGVVDFIRRAEAAGEISVAPGPETWTARRLVLADALRERIRRLVRVNIAAWAPFYPEFGALLDIVDDDARLSAFFLTFATLALLRRDLINYSASDTDVFRVRDFGGGVMLHFICVQTEPRTQFLEGAHVSRRKLAANFGISRPHVSRMLADGEAAGLFSPDGPDRIVFSPAFSELLERQAATFLQFVRAACVAADLTAPIDHAHLSRIAQIGAI